MGGKHQPLLNTGKLGCRGGARAAQQARHPSKAAGRNKHQQAPSSPCGKRQRPGRQAQQPRPHVGAAGRRAVAAHLLPSGRRAAVRAQQRPADHVVVAGAAQLHVSRWRVCGVAAGDGRLQVVQPDLRRGVTGTCCSPGACGQCSGAAARCQQLPGLRAPCDRLCAVLYSSPRSPGPRWSNSRPGLWTRMRHSRCTLQGTALRSTARCCTYAAARAPLRPWPRPATAVQKSQRWPAPAVHGAARLRVRGEAHAKLSSPPLEDVGRLAGGGRGKAEAVYLDLRRSQST
jgi:hypothetical protein